MPSSPLLATAPVLEVRARIRDRLAEIAGHVGALPSPAGELQRARMRRIATDLTATLEPHLRWEERTIHPLVDKYACEGPAAFSASMRYEHEIIYRWLADLRGLADGDAVLFARRADNLLGVVLAHFELEEHVLFPVLDHRAGREALRESGGDPSDRSR